MDKMPCLGAYAPSGTRTTNLLVTRQEYEPLDHSAPTSWLRADKTLSTSATINVITIFSIGSHTDVAIPKADGLFNRDREYHAHASTGHARGTRERTSGLCHAVTRCVPRGASDVDRVAIITLL